MSTPSDPEKLAVALGYDPETDHAPKVLAKGRGALAEKILEVAAQNGVVIDTSPELVQALSGLELDETIPVELYKALAEIISYVLKSRERLK